MKSFEKSENLADEDRISIPYIAGLFDGDGSIYIVVGRKGRKKPYHRLQCRLTNTHRGVLDMIAMYMKCGKVHTREGTNKPAYVWNMYNRQAGKMLARLLPYLIIKREQALLGLRFVETLKSERGGREKERLLTDADIKQRQEIKERIMRLNRGPGGAGHY